MGEPINGNSRSSTSPSFQSARKFPGIAAATICVLGTILVSTVPSVGAAGVGTDRNKISQLEQRIASQGAQVQTLVAQYDLVASRLAGIKQRISTDHAHLADDHRAVAKATIQLRHWVTDAYVNAETTTSASLIPFTKSANSASLSEVNVYLGVASGSLDSAMANLQNAEHRTAVTEGALQSEEVATTATLTQLATSSSQAQSALGSEDATLSQMNSNLLSLVTAANAKRAEAEKQAEEVRLASEQQSLQQTAITVAVSPAANPSPGSYANPLRSINGLSPERVDQGVDFGGYGPIYAIGDGTVISTFNGGWPGGTFISYKLTNGPAAGLVVYAAEDIEPKVQVGQTVNSNTVLGQMYEGSTGIETGWANASGDGTTLASQYGEFDGSNSTAFGNNFSQLLVSLGAPGGVVEISASTAGLPAGWPTW